MFIMREQMVGQFWSDEADWYF